MKKLTITIIVLFSQMTLAQKRPTYSFSLGGGAIWKQNIRNDNQYDKADKSTQFQAIPMAQIKLGPVSIAGPNLKLKLPKYKIISPYIAIKRSGERYYGPGMDHRKDSWFTEVGLNIIMFKLSYTRDIQSRSHGGIYDLSFSGRYMLGPLMLTYTLSHVILDKKFSNYYYGIRSHEVTSTRPYYQPGTTGTTSLAVMPIWMITKDWSMFNSLKFTLLGSRIRNSPTVARDSFISIMSGLTYKFN